MAILRGGNCHGPKGITDNCPNALTGASSTLFLLMINTLFGKKCTFLKESDFPADVNYKRLNDKVYDFIVVGAGSAGAIVASRLSEDPSKSVLLIEAGGYPPVDAQIPGLFVNLQGDPLFDWEYLTEKSNTSCMGMRNGNCVWNRGKMLGGSSAMNAMMYVRGNPGDYNEWADLTGDDNWKWDNVLEYYKKNEKTKAESLLNSDDRGHEGPLHTTKYKANHPMRDRIIDVYDELGYTLQNDEVPIGFFETTMSIDEFGRRESTGKTYLTNGQHHDENEPDKQKPLGDITPDKRKNLFISTNTHVMRVLIKNNNAYGVRVKVNRKEVNVMARNEIILSGGAINSPQILMLSGIGPKKELKTHDIKLIKDLPVGENLQDHFASWGVLMKADTDASPLPSDAQNNQNVFEYFNNGSGPLATISINNMLLLMDPAGGDEFATIQWLIRDFPAKSPNTKDFFVNAGFNNESVNDLVRINKKNVLLSFNPILLRPESTGVVKLRSSNPFQKVMVSSGYLTDTDNKDLEVMLSGIRFLKKMIDTNGFKEVNAEFVQYKIPMCDKEQLEFGGDDYWECLLRNMGSTMYHPVGTCKMGKEDDGGVVDSRLRVHGIQGLRVIDASVMPKITRCNTNAPVMMIGELGAELIQQDYGFKPKP